MIEWMNDGGDGDGGVGGGRKKKNWWKRAVSLLFFSVFYNNDKNEANGWHSVDDVEVITVTWYFWDLYKYTCKRYKQWSWW